MDAQIEVLINYKLRFKNNRQDKLLTANRMENSNKLVKNTTYFWLILTYIYIGC